MGEQSTQCVWAEPTHPPLSQSAVAENHSVYNEHSFTWFGFVSQGKVSQRQFQEQTRNLKSLTQVKENNVK